MIIHLNHCFDYRIYWQYDLVDFGIELVSHIIVHFYVKNKNKQFMPVCAILSNYKSRAAIWQIRMHVSFAIKWVVESYFCHLFVTFFKLVSFSVKCDKGLVFCLICGRYSVAIIIPIYFSTSSYQWPFSSVFFPGLCFFYQCPIYFLPYPQLFTETDGSMFTSF